MVLYEMHTWDHVMAVIICIFAPIMALTARSVSNEEIIGLLDESQRAKFADLEKKRQEFMRNRFKPHGGPFGPRGDSPRPPEGPP